MGIFFEENDPEAPWCACGTLCDGVADRHGRVGWCVTCEDWAVSFDGPLVLDRALGLSGPARMEFDPVRNDFRAIDPQTDEWLDP